MARKTGGTKRAARPARRQAARRGAARKAPRRRAPAARARAPAARKPAPVPAGMHTVTPSLTLSDCAAAIAYYEKAFGAKELMRFAAPDGRAIWHAEIRIGSSVVYLGDAMGRPVPSPEQPATTSIWLYVPDCDAIFDRAVKAGAKVATPMADMFWGDRCGMLVDPFGIPWAVASHVKDLSPQELRRASEAAARQMASGGAPPAGEPSAGHGEGI